jgi:hypothetical protein
MADMCRGVSAKQSLVNPSRTSLSSSSNLCKEFASEVNGVPIVVMFKISVV